MPIPDRFKFEAAPAELVARMEELCDAIEDATGLESESLLDEWHRHATRRFELVEFRTYWKSTDKETFVRSALIPQPVFVDDLTYAEVAAVIEAVLQVTISEWDLDYYLTWLERQFPDSNITDLVYWPDQWFDDPSLFRDASGAFKDDSQLSADQILGYVMAKSRRPLEGAPPDPHLPFPMPEK